MKKFKLLLIASGILLVIIVFVSQVNSSVRNTSFSSYSYVFPDSVKVILEKSCFSCHSNAGTNGFAKKVLNFDKWDTYQPNDQTKYKTKICDKVTADKMPPSGYIKKNPQLKLTEKEKTTLCDWAKPANK